MNTPQRQILADLLAEGDELHAVLRGLPASEWARGTPAQGWTIAHQVAHLAQTDTASILAAALVGGPRSVVRSLDRRQLSALWGIVGPTATFGVRRLGLPPEQRGAAALIDRVAGAGARRTPAALLEHWQDRRHRLAQALTRVPDGKKIPWAGPPMRPATMASARLMETFGHGQDILDALAITRVPTARLRHVADLGVRTRSYAYRVRGLSVPATAVRVTLTGPGGESWSWGSEDAPDTVTGTALAFCLLVTQRRHRDDCDLVARGPHAEQWLSIAQAFAGPPGSGREPTGGRR